MEKITVELTKEEIEGMINKLSDSENITLAAKCVDGEERIRSINRLKEYLK